MSIHQQIIGFQCDLLSEAMQKIPATGNHSDVDPSNLENALDLIESLLCCLCDAEPDDLQQLPDGFNQKLIALRATLINLHDKLA